MGEMFAMMGFRFTHRNMYKNIFCFDAVLNDRHFLQDEAFERAMLEDSIAVRITLGDTGHVHFPRMLTQTDDGD